jgi:hypothetical protein
MTNQPGVSVEIDDTSVREMFAKAQTETKVTIRQLVEGAAIDVQREMRIAVNVGATGDTRRSIRYSYNAALLRAEVEPNVPHAKRLEEGGPPIYLSVAPGKPLRKWADFKGLNPYAVRNSIAKKGTKAHPFVEPTYQKMKPIVEKDIADGISHMVEGLNRGV